MRRFVKAGILIGLCAAAMAVVIPGIRERGSLLLGRIAGSSTEPWSEVAVQMLPHRWHEDARRMLGYWAVEWTRSLTFPLDLASKSRLSHEIYLGATPNLVSLDCHYTVLAAGQTPHPPHVHDDEEIIIPLVGDVDIIRATAADSTETWEERIGFGRLVYHESRLPHTIRAVGPDPSGYLVFRWSAPAIAGTSDGALRSQSYDLGPAPSTETAGTQPVSKTLIFEGPTRLLSRLHVHATIAPLGEGSTPHRDRHDVAVVVLEGAVETTSGRVDAPGVIFHPAGRTHFLRSVGAQPARYLAIEFLERN